MEHTNMDYGRTVDLKKLCIEILKKWRMLFIAAFIGGVLLGGYQLTVRLTAEEKPVLSQDEIKELEEKLEDNEEIIKRRKNSITDQNDLLAELRKSKKKYEVLLEQATSTEPSDAEMLVEIVEINEKIIEKQSQITSAFTQIEALEDDITTLEKVNEELTESLEETTPVVRLRNILLWAVFGGMLGIAIVCVRVSISWSLDKTLQSVAEMKERFAIPVLGVLPSSTEPAGRNGKIDRWIARLDNDSKPVDPENEYALAAAKLQLLAQPGQKIMLTGTVERTRLEQVFAALQKNLPADGCNLFVADNPVHYPESMLQLKNSAVLLVEAVHVSETCEIGALADFLRLGEAAIIGALVL